MTDKLTPDARSENMRRIRSINTKPEMVVRRLVYGLGVRYRLHVKGLPGKPDLVFRGRKKVIFVHGCFFHQHAKCSDGRMPKSRIDYWIPKLTRNKSRDRLNRAALTRLGWRSLVIWDCETKELDALQAKIECFLA